MPTQVLEFFDNPDGKIFLFPDNHITALRVTNSGRSAITVRVRRRDVEAGSNTAASRAFLNHLVQVEMRKYIYI